eukprot:1066039-Amphidinium_carterae.1
MDATWKKRLVTLIVTAAAHRQLASQSSDAAGHVFTTRTVTPVFLSKASFDRGRHNCWAYRAWVIRVRNCHGTLLCQRRRNS